MTDARRPTDDPTPDPATPTADATPAAETAARGAPTETAATPPDPSVTAPDPAVTPPGDDAGGGGEVQDDGDEAEIDFEVLAESDPRSRAELLEASHRAEHERDEYLDDLRRAHADFENYRKRVMRESAVQRELGKVQVIEGILETLDDLDRTLQAAQSSPDTSLAKGVELVANKLASALQQAGVERVDVTGVAFDPEIHEAVQQVPADDPDAADGPVVNQILRPGYTLGERTLRAAMVVVAQ